MQLVRGSLKIFRPRSAAASGGFGLRTKSVSEYTKSATCVRRTPTFLPFARRLRLGGPRSSFTSAGSVEVRELRWMSAPWQVETSSAASQSPEPMRLRKVCSKSSTSSRSPFQCTVSIGLK